MDYEKLKSEFAKVLRCREPVNSTVNMLIAAVKVERDHEPDPIEYQKDPKYVAYAKFMEAYKAK